jgi:hypothetical protein
MSVSVSNVTHDLTPSGDVACVVCPHAAFFQARVEWGTGPERIRRRVNACASHVIDAIQLLRAWGHDSQLTAGWLTVLAIDPHALPRLAALGIADPGFVFYSARLSSHAHSVVGQTVGGRNG